MKRSTLSVAIRPLAVLMIAAVPETPAVAQQQPAFSLEEVVVTARRREENLMEVPLAISAVSAQDIEAAGIRDLNTLAQYTPGLWAEAGVNSRNNRQLTFRGLSVSTGQVFVDGAPYAGAGVNGAGGTPNLGDLARVEVLVGPQSVYFGRSTFEGAVNFVTKDPGDKFKGKVNAEYAKFGTTDDQISLEGPIVPGKLGARVTGRHYSTAGQWVNQGDTSNRLGQQSTNSVTGIVLFTPTDDLKAKVLLDYTVDDDGPPPDIALKGDKEIFCQLGGTQGSYYCGALPSVDKIDPSIISGNNVVAGRLYDLLIGNINNYPLDFPTSFMTHFGFRQKTYMGHLNIDYAPASGWTFSSITAFHRTQSQTIISPVYRNSQNLRNPALDLRLPNGQPQFPLAPTDRCVCLITQSLAYDGSEEVRVTSPQTARLRGTAGANYLYVRDKGSVGPYGMLQVGPAYTGIWTRRVSSTPAVFGGIYYDLAENLTLGAEARYQWDKITATAKYPTTGAPLTNTYKSFSPRVTVDYKYAPDSLIYALWSRGYRPGGFNAALVGQPQSVLDQLASNNATTAYAQERLDNFEGGIKSTWLNGRLRTRIDGYYDKWNDGQVPNTLFYRNANNTIVQITLTTNIGAVDLYGMESEAEYAVTKNLTVSATLNYQGSDIKSYVYIPEGNNIRGSTNVNGNKFPQAPDWTWTFSGTYTDTLSGDWEWFSRLDYRHRGRYYIDPTNVAWIGGTDIVDLHVGVKNGTVLVEGYVKNLTNNLNFANGVKGNDSLSNVIAPNRNEIRLWLPQKRVFGIRGSYSF
jgi:iron complex outermembrane receptor protein